MGILEGKDDSSNKIEEIPEKPEEYKGVLYIRPTYLLEDPQIAARVEIYFPLPNYSDF